MATATPKSKKLYSQKLVEEAYTFLKNKGTFKDWAAKARAAGFSYTCVEQVRAAVREMKYHKSSKAEKRVAIAQDAILHVQSGLISPSTGDYGSIKYKNRHLEDLYHRLDRDTQLNEFVKDNKDHIKCTACVKGGLMFCHIMKENHYQIEDFGNGFNNGEIRRRLTRNDLFSDLQLDMIETAFERDIVTDSTGKLSRRDGGSSVGRKCMLFGMRYGNEKGRFIAIMENIIENKGTFVP